ncbi:NUDIX hydrolase [Emticicia oligotrophica DSM 17448]|uniref:GDP-mannose pyrophosphatase n=1 Tax=Emticicia oligotrophica (strain DSM 17448 / CIP 109782 / MTCC 6937 / GPTSA100-15) TaxID=929562 RepID=A0ABN4ARS0_EMTOG|nr:NUDIX hydrolase [Emticicia oligotrophica]AFK05254.1 NUDIX hydrolase [Emticicia oligotrophica DSM 17448]
MNENINPWKILDSEVRYENNWIQVVHQNVINPSGGKGIYGVVNFKNIAVGVVPIDKEGYTWLVGQYRFPLNEYSWEIPEGGCPDGEEVLETAKRELKEETGLIAQKWQLISKLHTSNSVCNEVAYIFLAEDLTQSESQPEDTEQLQVKKVLLKEALEMVLSDEITDSMSVAGILKVARLKGL